MKNCLCLNWLRGVCVYDSPECKFAHGFDDIKIDIVSKFDKELVNEL